MNDCEIEIPFNGTPYRFAQIAEGFSRERQRREKNAPLFRVQSRYAVDDYVVTVQCGRTVWHQEVEQPSPWEFLMEESLFEKKPRSIRFRDVSKFEKWGEITSRRKPLEKALLRPIPENGHEREFEREWQLLLTELKQHGWIEQAQPIIAEILPVKKNNKGRVSQYSQQVRDETVVKWRTRDRTSDVRTLDVYLVDEFGEHEITGSFEPKPLVSRSTFYTWQRDYLKRNPERRAKKHRSRQKKSN